MAYSHPGAGTASDDLDGDDLQALVASSAAPILAMQPTTSVDTPAEHAGDAVTVDLAQGTVSFSFPASSMPSIALDDGSDAHVEEAFASIVREQDGAVQVATVIEGTLSPTEYAYDFDADAASLEGTQGWSLLVGSFGQHMPVGTVRNSMRQQWDCHVVGGIAELGTFDLETWRPSKPRWVGRIGTTWPLSAVCNW